MEKKEKGKEKKKKRKIKYGLSVQAVQYEGRMFVRASVGYVCAALIGMRFLMCPAATYDREPVDPTAPTNFLAFVCLSSHWPRDPHLSLHEADPT